MAESDITSSAEFHIWVAKVQKCPETSSGIFLWCNSQVGLPSAFYFLKEKRVGLSLKSIMHHSLLSTVTLLYFMHIRKTTVKILSSSLHTWMLFLNKSVIVLTFSFYPSNGYHHSY